MKTLERYRPTVAIDVGTTWTRMLSARTGLVQEPSLLAVDRASGEVVAWGRAAVERLRRDGAAVRVLRPTADGMVSDYAGFTLTIKTLLGRVGGGGLRPRVLIARSPGMTAVELTALQGACREAGAERAQLLPSPLAAALGAGLPIEAVAGHMVVEAGAGACTAAVFSQGGAVVVRTARFGSGAIDSALDEYLRREYGFRAGAESIRLAKERHALAEPPVLPEVLPPITAMFDLRGMDQATALPRTVSLERRIFRACAWAAVTRLCDLVGQTLAETPPELAGDLLENGIALTGGLARLEGLATELSRFTGCAVHVPAEPELATVQGLSLLGEAQSSGRRMHML